MKLWRRRGSANRTQLKNTFSAVRDPTCLRVRQNVFRKKAADLHVFNPDSERQRIVIGVVSPDVYVRVDVIHAPGPPTMRVSR